MVGGQPVTQGSGSTQEREVSVAVDATPTLESASLIEEVQARVLNVGRPSRSFRREAIEMAPPEVFRRTSPAGSTWRSKRRAELAAAKAAAAAAVARKIKAKTSTGHWTGVFLPTIMKRVRSCESGANGYSSHGWAFDSNYGETNPNSTASGAWQFLNSTWHYVTGLPGRMKNYSKAKQDWAAMKLYHSEGLRPWYASKSCWGH